VNVRAWQILPMWLYDYTYAWANVKIYRSGKVHVDIFGFDSNMGPTRLVKGWDIN
jgi:hypothetical protein